MTKSVIQYFMGHLNGILNSISRKRPFLFHEQTNYVSFAGNVSFNSIVLAYCKDHSDV